MSGDHWTEGPVRWAWWEIAATVGTVLALILLSLSLQGCASCRPACCADCPPQIELVERPPEIVLVRPPEVVVPETPDLIAIERAELAADDPVGWLRLLAADVLSLLDALERAQVELQAINTTAPPEVQP